MRDFVLLPLAIPLSLPECVPHLRALWWCFSAQNGFTSSKTSLLYLYFTTPLENHASWAAELWAEKRERDRNGRRPSEEGRERERRGNERWRKKGRSKQQAKTEKRVEKDKQVKTVKEGESVVYTYKRERGVEKHKRGREVDRERLSGHPEIVCDNMITQGA